MSIEYIPVKFKVPWWVKLRVGLWNWLSCGYIKITPEDTSWNEYNKRWKKKELSD